MGMRTISSPHVLCSGVRRAGCIRPVLVIFGSHQLHARAKRQAAIVATAATGADTYAPCSAGYVYDTAVDGDLAASFEFTAADARAIFAAGYGHFAAIDGDSTTCFMVISSDASISLFDIIDQ